MKKFLAGAIGLVALGIAAPASAADVAPIPYARAHTYIPALYDWSGFYIGANGGYGSNRSCWDRVPVGGGPVIAGEGCHNAPGAVAGGQIGYRAQFGSWVYGVEAQGDWVNFRGSNVSQLDATLTNQTRINSIALFTGQVGYAWNNALFYVKGGAALIDDKYQVRTTAADVLVATSVKDYGRWGGTAGVGIEYGFANDWSAAIEYDRLFMGNRLIGFTPATGSTLPATADRIRSDVDVVTVRVNYRWGGPVIARY
jgi:outer membrane immunogenic protein